MINFENIKEFSTAFPKTWTFLGWHMDADKIPEEHKDQIYFLNEEASKFLREYIESSKMMTGPVWKPFNERYFKSLDEFKLTGTTKKEIKKWLYNKPIPFGKFVYLDGDKSGQVIMLTWKMVIKYWEGLFFADDISIFDETLNWGLFYFHEDTLVFGTDKIYDKEFEYEKVKEINDLQHKYFNKENLNFDKNEKKQAIKDFKEKYNTDKME
jgi:hypothetical protein